MKDYFSEILNLFTPAVNSVAQYARKAVELRAELRNYSDAINAPFYAENPERAAMYHSITAKVKDVESLLNTTISETTQQAAAIREDCTIALVKERAVYDCHIDLEMLEMLKAGIFTDEEFIIAAQKYSDNEAMRRLFARYADQRNSETARALVDDLRNSGGNPYLFALDNMIQQGAKALNDAQRHNPDFKDPATIIEGLEQAAKTLKASAKH